MHLYELGEKLQEESTQIFVFCFSRLPITGPLAIDLAGHRYGLRITVSLRHVCSNWRYCSDAGRPTSKFVLVFVPIFTFAEETVIQYYFTQVRALPAHPSQYGEVN